MLPREWSPAGLLRHAADSRLGGLGLERDPLAHQPTRGRCRRSVRTGQHGPAGCGGKAPRNRPTRHSLSPAAFHWLVGRIGRVRSRVGVFLVTKSWPRGKAQRPRSYPGQRGRTRPAGGGGGRGVGGGGDGQRFISHLEIAGVYASPEVKDLVRLPNADARASGAGGQTGGGGLPSLTANRSQARAAGNGQKQDAQRGGPHGGRITPGRKRALSDSVEPVGADVVDPVLLGKRRGGVGIARPPAADGEV